MERELEGGSKELVVLPAKTLTFSSRDPLGAVLAMSNVVRMQC